MRTLPSYKPLLSNLHWMCREFIQNANDPTRSIDFMSIILYTIFVKV